MTHISDVISVELTDNELDIVSGGDKAKASSGKSSSGNSGKSGQMEYLAITLTNCMIQG